MSGDDWNSPVWTLQDNKIDIRLVGTTLKEEIIPARN